ncbi:uncharacterized protein A4U43_C08F22060 [Asparagus officinalis]|nr:uncharacterized protein A4U43_C08F22060 [Asparagus officinalis]
MTDREKIQNGADQDVVRAPFNPNGAGTVATNEGEDQGWINVIARKRDISSKLANTLGLSYWFSMTWDADLNNELMPSSFIFLKYASIA